MPWSKTATAAESSGFSRDVRGMIVEDQLERGAGRIGGIEQLEELDELSARCSTGRPLRVHLHAQARLLAQPRRGLLLQVRSFGPAPHPGRIEARAQAAHPGWDRGCQSPPRHPHL